jgi:hypothetical protein
MGEMRSDVKVESENRNDGDHLGNVGVHRRTVSNINFELLPEVPMKSLSSGI